MMETIRDRLWIWGHTAGSHNGRYDKIEGSVMSPFEGAAYLGARNVFMIVYGNNPRPPFDKYSRCLSPLRDVKYSIVGNASSSEDFENLGDMTELIAQAKKFANVTGGVFDDFFSEHRLKLYTPEVLSKMRDTLHRQGKPLDMWCVIYDYQLKDPIAGSVKQFDGVSFWTWKEKDLENFEENYANYLKLTDGQKRMLGLYLYDYGDNKNISKEAVEFQLNRYSKCLQKGEIEGIIFCSNTVMDLGLEAVEFARNWIAENGNTPLTQEKQINER